MMNGTMRSATFRIVRCSSVVSMHSSDWAAQLILFGIGCWRICCRVSSLVFPAPCWGERLGGEADLACYLAWKMTWQPGHVNLHGIKNFCRIWVEGAKKWPSQRKLLMNQLKSRPWSTMLMGN